MGAHAMFSDRLRIIMRKNEWNQKMVASIAGVTEQTVSRWFRRGLTPTDGSIYKIAQACNVSVGWLAAGEESSNIHNGGIMVAENMSTYNADQMKRTGEQESGGSISPEINVAEGMSITKDVLESGTGYANALWHNLKSFDDAVKKEGKVKELERKMDLLLEKMENMERAVVAPEQVDKKREANGAS